MNKMQIFAKALLEQIEVARVRQLSGLQESFNTKHADTARAIGIFQKYAGLDQTGLPDPKTMNTIKMVAEVGNPVRPPAAGAPAPAAPAAGAPAAGAPAAGAPAAGAPAAKPKPKPVFDKSVQDLQRQLIAKGAKIKDDGFMGPLTQAAMKQFGAKGPASGANPAAASPNPNANEFEIAQAQAAGGAGAAPGKSPYAPAAPAAPTAAPAAGDAAKNPVGTTNAATAIPTGGLENPANQAKPPANSVQAASQATPGVNNGGAKANDDAGAPGELDAAIDTNLANMARDAGDNAEKAAAWNDKHNAAEKLQAQQLGTATPAGPAPAPAPAAPAGPQPQAVGDDYGNTTFTTADGKTMVVGPDGKQIMPGSNPNLPQNQGALNKLGNWLTNKGQYQKPGGFQPPPGAAKPAAPASQSTDMGRPDMGVSGESFNRSNQRMVEDPELTAMLRIAGLR